MALFLERSTFPGDDETDHWIIWEKKNGWKSRDIFWNIMSVNYANCKISMSITLKYSQLGHENYLYPGSC